MAVTARDGALRLVRRSCCIVTVALALFARAKPDDDASSEARSQVAAVAEALTAGDAEEAMTHFAKSCPDYVKVRRYFEGLSAFSVENQLNVTDEEETDKGVALTITWDITLTGMTTDQTKRRTGEVHATVGKIDSKWRIVEFAPLDIFDPQINSR